MSILSSFKTQKNIFNSKQCLARFRTYFDSSITRFDSDFVNDKSKFKEKKRKIYRERFKNKSDPSETGEAPMPSWSEKKGKALYRFITEYVNTIHKNGKHIPEKEKQEYIKNSKEFNLYCLDKYRKQKAYEDMILNNQKEFLNNLELYPEYLRDEIIAGKATYEEKHPFYSEETIQQKRTMFTSEFLYFEQKMRVLPDDIRTIERAVRGGVKEGEILPENEIEADVNIIPREKNDLYNGGTDYKIPSDDEGVKEKYIKNISDDPPTNEEIYENQILKEEIKDGSYFKKPNPFIEKKLL